MPSSSLFHAFDKKFRFRPLYGLCRHGIPKQRERANPRRKGLTKWKKKRRRLEKEGRRNNRGR